MTFGLADLDVKPASFSYHAPRTLDDAIAKLRDLEDAKVLAGGQSLMPMMNLRFVSPANVVDINRIPELSSVRLVDGDLVIGALARQAALLDNELVRRHCPLLVEALGHTGHLQTRSRGTIGGSLCHLDPAAEQPLVCLVLNATMTVQGPNGKRSIPTAAWALAYMTPGLEADQNLTSISLPARKPRQGDAFVEFARRHGDFAIACVGCSLLLDASGAVSSVAIGVGGLAATALRLTGAEQLLQGKIPSQALIGQAAALGAAIDATDDAYYTASYRRKLASTFIERALQTAVARATETQNDRI